jgi:hypothetical protein
MKSNRVLFEFICKFHRICTRFGPYGYISGTEGVLGGTPAYEMRTFEPLLPINCLETAHTWSNSADYLHITCAIAHHATLSGKFGSGSG